VILTVFLLKSSGSIEPSKITPGETQVVKLGSMQKLRMTNLGDLHYSLAANSAYETHLSIGFGMTTSLATYFELYDVKFDCDLKDVGRVHFSSSHAKIDLAMQHLRLTAPVFISFDSSYSATATKVDVNLKTGHVKSTGMWMNIHGHRIDAGARKWQIH